MSTIEGAEYPFYAEAYEVARNASYESTHGVKMRKPAGIPRLHHGTARERRRQISKLDSGTESRRG